MNSLKGLDAVCACAVHATGKTQASSAQCRNAFLTGEMFLSAIAVRREKDNVIGNFLKLLSAQGKTHCECQANDHTSRSAMKIYTDSPAHSVRQATNTCRQTRNSKTRRYRETATSPLTYGCRQKIMRSREKSHVHKKTRYFSGLLFMQAVRS
ncbi:hypothetical protein [Herminiimonas fonticola]|uniref:hypothetical protein n=1 Tax=Herminiimonas fonticola TaxID=303380 RepID=UPI00333E3EC4